MLIILSSIYENDMQTLSHTVRNLHFLSKNSTLISRENCWFFGWRTRENVGGLGLSSSWQLWFHEKNCQKKIWAKKSWKCWGYVKIKFLDKNLTSNGVDQCHFETDKRPWSLLQISLREKFISMLLTRNGKAITSARLFKWYRISRMPFKVGLPRWQRFPYLETLRRSRRSVSLNLEAPLVISKECPSWKLSDNFNLELAVKISVRSMSHLYHNPKPLANTRPSPLRPVLGSYAG